MKLKVTERQGQSTDGKRKLRYYTSIDHGARITKDEFVSQLNLLYALPVCHILTVLDATERYLAEHISQGDIVEVPYLGIFKETVRAKTTDDKSQAGEQAVTRTKVNFLPGKDLYKDLGL